MDSTFATRLVDWLAPLSSSRQHRQQRAIIGQVIARRPKRNSSDAQGCVMHDKPWSGNS